VQPRTTMSSPGVVAAGKVIDLPSIATASVQGHRGRQSPPSVRVYPLGGASLGTLPWASGTGGARSLFTQGGIEPLIRRQRRLRTRWTLRGTYTGHRPENEPTATP
jgi:hypothetical protein